MESQMQAGSQYRTAPIRETQAKLALAASMSVDGVRKQPSILLWLELQRRVARRSLSVQDKASGGYAKCGPGNRIGQPVYVFLHSHVGSRARDPVADDTTDPSIFIASRLGEHGANGKCGARV